MNCKYSKYCGGCVDLEKEYSEHLQTKQKNVEDMFSKVADTKVSECISNYYPYKYRNKIHLAFTELKGKTLVGFFEEGSTKVVDIDHCHLFGDWATKLIAILREYVSRFKIRAYKDGAGILRYAHARCVDNKLQLTLVAVTDNFAGRKWLYNKLAENYSQVSFYLNINRRTDRAIFDNRFKHVDGEKYLNFEVMGVNVSLSPSSFLQVNLPVATKMYKKAIDMLNITKNTTVIDLYSGIGITSVAFAKLAKKVISIEEVKSAVDNAKVISKINGVSNIDILLGKCEEIIGNIKTEEFDDIVVFVDPARAGLDNKVVNVLKVLNPRCVVYMSCNPETCVSDCRELLKDTKYQIADIKLGDMFPFTKHIEALVYLKNKDN